MKCTRCEKDKDNLIYTKKKGQASEKVCNDCMRWINYERNYNLTKDQYIEIYQEQKGQCAICKKDENLCTPVGPKKTRMLVVDHCHKTNRVRGLLCLPCNTAVGAINEDLDSAMELVAYLIRHL